jgi:hypothetical protein
MKIADSNILLAGTRSFVEKDETEAHLRVRLDPGDRGLGKDRVTITEAAKSHLIDASKPVDEGKGDPSHSHQITLEALLVESLSGREVNLLDVSAIQREADSPDAPETAGRRDDQAPETRQGWGIAYRREDTHYEGEAVSLTGAGIIQTVAGEEIEFSLRLEMSREFIDHHSLNLRAGDAALMDPIVLSFDGKAAELSDLKFSFDLNSDGVSEEVPLLRPGTGFLALDRNDDGMINNGRELFGPETGEGFAELSSFDEDANHWIDESDPIYERLAVWSMDQKGNPSLHSLREKQIGALYLGNLSSRFDLKGPENALQGRITKTGVFLYEHGTPSIIQELDLVV